MTLSLLALWLATPGGGVVRGAVLDAATGRPISGAVVAVLDATPPRVTNASAVGTFAIRLPGDTARLVAALIGYAPETLAVALGDPTVAFHLHQAPLALDPVTVAVERTFESSTATTPLIRALDIQLRPRESSQELLRLAPGLLIAQHAGGGKAEQIFLRGFDADHGTDVAIGVDGVPVNMVSHAHGQGYADLHWLIPEIVADVAVHKGPYDAEDGDLATAGAVDVRTQDRIAQAEVSTRGGSFTTGHTLALVPLGAQGAPAGGYLAGAAHYTNGPFVNPQHYGRDNLFGKWTMPVSSAVELIATASGYDGRWDASGQIPERSVRSGLISRFGSLDPSEGGNTQRYAATLGLRSTEAAQAKWQAQAYAIRYGLQLFSDFTFFLHDSINGDGIEQLDRRSVLGVAATVGLPTALSAGAGVRADFIDVGLFPQRNRVRLGTRLDERISQQNPYVWVRQDLQLSARVRLQVGVRGDAFRFGVTDRLGGQTSGVRWEALLSPKTNVAVQVSERTTLFGNIGYGFHSNDARDVVAAPRTATVVPRALGAEVGMRHYWTGGTLAVALWRTDLASELVYNGDEGTTDASGATRRYGVDLEVRTRLFPWLWADADVNLAHGRFRDEAQKVNRIPLAPRATSTGGLTLRDLGPVSGALRYRHIGSRPADQAGSIIARGYTIVEMAATWRIAHVAVVATVDNLLNSTWNEAQFATTSRLPSEPAAVTELNFTPGTPRALQIGLEYRF
jgi:hypothetical protein